MNHFNKTIIVDETKVIIPQFFLNILWKVGVQGWKDGAEAFNAIDAPGDSKDARGFMLNVPGLYRNIF